MTRVLVFGVCSHGECVTKVLLFCVCTRNYVAGRVFPWCECMCVWCVCDVCVMWCDMCVWCVCDVCVMFVWCLCDVCVMCAWCVWCVCDVHVMCVWGYAMHDTGRQRHIRCLQLQVSFRKRATIYRALLGKIPYTDKAFYGSLPPCTLNIRTYPYFIRDSTALFIEQHIKVLGRYAREK